jgi:predicted acylesterase/phospholipase RssA/CRP-like cAMP-binding protein
MSPLPSTSERLGLLASRPVLHGLPTQVLEEVNSALESVQVPGGSCIVRRGQVDVPLVLVLRGGLRASFVDQDGRRHVAFEYFRGSTAGEALILSGKPSPLDVHAIRDSHLLSLSRQRFTELAERYPSLFVNFARVATSRLVDLMASPELLQAFAQRVDRLPRTISLVLVGGQDVGRTADLLVEALSRARWATHLGVQQARVAQPQGAGIEHGPLMEWVDRASAKHELVILDSEPSDLKWLDFCLGQADRTLVLIGRDAKLSGKDRALWAGAGLGERPGHLELAVVHPESTDEPRGPAGRLDLPGVTRRHQVRAGDRRDAERLARWLLDRPVGLVLGGGGAYGIAHVGVIKALEEAAVPIDVVGGTSMGAIFAGGVARRWPADRIMENVRSLFSSRFALYDPTIPLKSLLAGRKLERVLENLFGDLSFDETWLPMFCIATDISHASIEVRDTGSLLDAIRASVSIPGLFPPCLGETGVLVDGGLVDNLPVDAMAERCDGPIVAVNVFDPQGRKGAQNGHQEGLLSALLRWVNPFANLRVPLFDTLTRSTFVGSQHATVESLARHPPALYLSPDVTSHRILEWGAYDALFQAGYTCAKRELATGALPRSSWEGRLDEPSV